MPLRSVSADPETLARLQEAFDLAWAAVSKDFEPSAAPAARERLGCIFVDLWRAEPGSDLVAGSVEKFLGGQLLPKIPKHEPLANPIDD